MFYKDLALVLWLRRYSLSYPNKLNLDEEIAKCMLIAALKYYYWLMKIHSAQNCKRHNRPYRRRKAGGEGKSG